MHDYNTCTATVVWRRWVYADCTATIDTSCATVPLGYYDTCTSTSATQTAVWVRWNGEETSTIASRYYITSACDVDDTETAEQKNAAILKRREEAELRRLEAEKRAVEAAQKAREAYERAEKLLLDALDKIQAEQYKKDKKITVQSKTGEIFELASAWSGNAVEITPDGKRLARFCIHPREQIPIPDLLLAQKLMLETDPESFRRIANRTPFPVG